MDKKFVVANWKMNLIRSQAEKLAKEITGYLSDLGTKNSPGVIIAPAFTLLESVFSVIKGTDIELCAQNVFWETSGAYLPTGESQLWSAQPKFPQATGCCVRCCPYCKICAL